MAIDNKWEPPLQTHDKMVAEWMKDPKFRMAYDALEEEFQLLREMLKARKRAGLTQEAVAKKNGHQSAGNRTFRGYANCCKIFSEHSDLT